MRRFLRRYGADSRGNVAIVFTLAAIPVIGGVGVAIDYTRAYRVQSDLQYSVDAAALAGASQVSADAVSGTVDDYMASNLGAAVADYAIDYDIDIEPSTVMVSAEAAVPTTIGALFREAIPVSAAATAFHGPPIRIVDLQVTEFNADAWDANSIYWYIVPEDGGVPEPEDMHLFLSNDPHNPAPEVPEPMVIGVGDVIGFALVNVTGGVRPYGQNSYGQPQGSVHTYYSHLEPENVRNTGSGSCSSGTVEHAWDDNGGGSDDNDYDDAVYDFSCTEVRTDPSTVFLLR